MISSESSGSPWLIFVAVAITGVTLAGCGAQGAIDRRAAALSDTPMIGSGSDSWSDRSEQGIDYDPWEPVNERIFWLNHDVLDHYAIKPAATAWQHVVPRLVRHSIANAFDNLGMPDRFVNNLLQGRFEGAGREMVRLVINTTVGVAGFFDVASRLGVRQSDADTGQTLGVYGMGPGPYVQFPLMQPLDVRDGIGYGIDLLLDPVSYFAPFIATLGPSIVNRLNDRAENLDRYQDVEEASLDLYAAVRNGYLQSRQNSIENAIRDRRRQWSLLGITRTRDTEESSETP
jgi:phospholipid-binding lipoprotein MlaA